TMEKFYIEEFKFLIQKKIFIQLGKKSCKTPGCPSIELNIKNLKEVCSLCNKALLDRACFILDQSFQSDLNKCYQEILVLSKIAQKNKESFMFTPQSNIYYSDNKDDKNEFDIICIINQQFIIGEVKTNSSQFDDVIINKI